MVYPGMLNPLPAGSFKAGVYNKVRIECIGNEIKTWINGLPAAYVIDDVDRSGLIALQVHAINNDASVGKKIYWKNIRIKTDDLKPSLFLQGNML